MTVDFFLVRHGEAAASWGQSPDPGLSETGRIQAQAAADALQRQLREDVQLLSSPLTRARETAEPLAAALSRPVAIDEVFREVPAPVPLAQRKDWLRTFMQQRWDEQPEELHHWRDSACNRLLSLQSPTVVFTHFLVINAVVGRVLQQPGVCHFYPDNGSITHLRRDADGLHLVTLGRELETVVN